MTKINKLNARDVSTFIKIAEKSKMSNALLFRNLIEFAIGNEEEIPTIETFITDSEGKRQIFDIEEEDF
tara:strand:- start:50 stop:256 length:207 start_codon:yes stop_codon:yes gene_type:complete